MARSLHKKYFGDFSNLGSQFAVTAYIEGDNRRTSGNIVRQKSTRLFEIEANGHKGFCQLVPREPNEGEMSIEMTLDSITEGSGATFRVVMGVDQVSINTAAVQNSEVVKDSSQKFGSQCIVVAIDAKNNGDMWEIYTHGGRNKTGIDAIKFAKKMEESGAGELLVTSMDRDGTQVGYDIDLMSKISAKVNIPVIASGGVGNLDHLVDGIKLGKASAVLAASIFHYGKYSIKQAKEYLDSKGIPVRI